VIVVLAVAIVLMFLVVAGPHPRSYGIPSSADVPTLKPGDHILVRSGHGNIGRGGFVVFHFSGQKFTRIMRVVAIGGDRVSEGSAGNLELNGLPDKEPYLPAEADTENVPILTVPVGFVFVMGDNRGNSEDSRFLGPVSLRDVVGRAVIRWWPLTRLGGL
jgi:signal peptidase I